MITMYSNYCCGLNRLSCTNDSRLGPMHGKLRSFAMMMISDHDHDDVHDVHDDDDDFR